MDFVGGGERLQEGGCCGGLVGKVFRVVRVESQAEIVGYLRSNILETDTRARDSLESDAVQ